MKIQFNNLSAQWQIIKDVCRADIDNLFEKSNFILGEPVKEFEMAFAEYVGCKFAVGVSSGTDAVKLAAEALSLEGESCFIIPANTFVATLMAIEQAYPNSDFNLIDCDEYYQMNVIILREYVQENREKYEHMIIVPVHLYGYACDMTAICKIAEEYNCQILEDASQAHGTKWKNRTVGGFGAVSAFSLYPGKNLGAAGDAGIVITNSEQVYEKLLLLRNLGSKEKYKHIIKGGNYRLDTIQAIILKEKIKYLEEWNQNRRNIVKKYETLIKNAHITLPENPAGCLPIHHIYPVRIKNRMSFTAYLNDHGIQWGIHFPTCMEQMDMYSHLSKPNTRTIKYSNEMVSLPIHPFMKDEEVGYLCKILNEYSGV